MVQAAIVMHAQKCLMGGFIGLLYINIKHSLWAGKKTLNRFFERFEKQQPTQRWFDTNTIYIYYLNWLKFAFDGIWLYYLDLFLNCRNACLSFRLLDVGNNAWNCIKHHAD